MKRSDPTCGGCIGNPADTPQQKDEDPRRLDTPNAAPSITPLTRVYESRPTICNAVEHAFRHDSRADDGPEPGRTMPRRPTARAPRIQDTRTTRYKRSTSTRIFFSIPQTQTLSAVIPLSRPCPRKRAPLTRTPPRRDRRRRAGEPAPHATHADRDARTGGGSTAIRWCWCLGAGTGVPGCVALRARV